MWKIHSVLVLNLSNMLQNHITLCYNQFGVYIHKEGEIMLLSKDIKKIPRLILALFILSLGIVLIKQSKFGLDPWGVFHEGLDVVSVLSFGVIIQVLGVLILILSLFIKIYPGIGTVLNIGLVGWFIDLLLRIDILQIPSSIYLRVIFFVLGFLVLNFGRSMYISCNLGAGPRDGLFVGIVKITQIDVKYVKPAIELIVFVAGVLLGGTWGFGTLILIIVSGYFVELFFKVLKYDPKQRTHSSINMYFKRTTT